jgi:hypothetical protein
LRIDQRVNGCPSRAGRVVAVAATNFLVVVIEQAGTASRPLRVQAGQPDLVEPVDHVADGVLVGLDQAGDHRDGVAAPGGQQDHRPPVPH